MKIKEYSSLIILLAVMMTEAMMRTEDKLSLPLVRSVQSSKEARRTLKDIPVQWLQVEESDSELSARLEKAIPVVSRPHHNDPDFRDYNEETRKEWFELYVNDRMDPANNELSPLLACIILRGLARKEKQSFLDIGSSRGSLVLCAAACGYFCRVTGLELSPRSHREALAASTYFQSNFDQRVQIPQFFNGDLRTFPYYADYDLIYCAIRGAKSRPNILHEALTHIYSNPANFPHGRPKRFVCAGFGIDTRLKPYAKAVNLLRAFCVRRRCIDDDHNKLQILDSSTSYDVHILRTTEALYGDNEGPRVLLEYELTAPSIEDDISGRAKREVNCDDDLSSSFLEEHDVEDSSLLRKKCDYFNLS